VSAPQAWATVRLTDGRERVLVMLTDVDEVAFYGSPISHEDTRVVFPKDTWTLCGEDE